MDFKYNHLNYSELLSKRSEKRWVTSATDPNKVVKSLGLTTANKLSALSFSKDNIHLKVMKHIR